MRREPKKSRAIETLDDKSVVWHVVVQLLQRLVILLIVLGCVAWGAYWLWSRVKEWL